MGAPHTHPRPHAATPVPEPSRHVCTPCPPPSMGIVPSPTLCKGGHTCAPPHPLKPASTRPAPPRGAPCFLQCLLLGWTGGDGGAPVPPLQHLLRGRGDARARCGGARGGREAGTCRGEWGCHLPGVSQGQLGPAATQPGDGWSPRRAAPSIFRSFAPGPPPWPPTHPIRCSQQGMDMAGAQW